MRQRLLGMATFTLLTCAALATPAYAQYDYGVRAGISGQPDQVFLGVHLDTPSLGHVTTFRPNVEVGFGGNTSRFGSDVILLTVNLELVHWMPLPNTPWKLYAGGGAGANFLHNGDANLFNNGLTPGVNVVFGLQHEKGLFAEITSGIQPNVKIAVGYVLKK